MKDNLWKRDETGCSCHHTRHSPHANTMHSVVPATMRRQAMLSHVIQFYNNSEASPFAERYKGTCRVAERPGGPLYSPRKELFFDENCPLLGGITYGRGQADHWLGTGSHQKACCTPFHKATNKQSTHSSGRSSSDACLTPSVSDVVYPLTTSTHTAFRTPRVLVDYLAPSIRGVSHIRDNGASAVVASPSKTRQAFIRTEDANVRKRAAVADRVEELLAEHHVSDPHGGLLLDTLKELQQLTTIHIIQPLSSFLWHLDDTKCMHSNSYSCGSFSTCDEDQGTFTLPPRRCDEKSSLLDASYGKHLVTLHRVRQALAREQSALLTLEVLSADISSRAEEEFDEQQDASSSSNNNNNSAKGEFSLRVQSRALSAFYSIQMLYVHECIAKESLHRSLIVAECYATYAALKRKELVSEVHDVWQRQYKQVKELYRMQAAMEAMQQAATQQQRTLEETERLRAAELTARNQQHIEKEEKTRVQVLRSVSLWEEQMRQRLVDMESDVRESLAAQRHAYTHSAKIQAARSAFLQSQCVHLLSELERDRRCRIVDEELGVWTEHIDVPHTTWLSRDPLLTISVDSSPATALRERSSVPPPPRPGRQTLCTRDQVAETNFSKDCKAPATNRGTTQYITFTAEPSHTGNGGPVVLIQTRTPSPTA